MTNKEFMKHTYDEIHAPEALFGKVMDMNMEKKEMKRRNVVKYVVCTLAALVLTFFASNGVCYAATGESLVTKINVYVNGKATEEDINWTKDGDSYTGTVNFSPEEGEEVEFSVETDNPAEVESDINVKTYTEENENGEMEEVVEMEINHIKEGEANSVTFEEKAE